MATPYEKRVAAARKAGFSSPYQQRIARAEAKGYDRAKARGHGSHSEENARRRVQRLAKQTETLPYTDKHGQYHDPVGDARANKSWTYIEQELRDKKETLNSPDYIMKGKERWQNRDNTIDPAFYWYHRS